MAGPVSFQLQTGTLNILLGPNGSGKSTLIKGISGEIPTSKGAIYLNNKPLHSYSRKERSLILSVASQNPVVPALNVLEYVLMGRIPHWNPWQLGPSHSDQQSATEALAQCGIAHLLKSQMQEISGGERQMALMARILTQNTPLLLLDEPTSNLDIAHQKEILDLLYDQVHSFGRTVFMILHDLNTAAEYADHLFLLSNGKLAATGTPHEVLDYRILEEVYRTPVICTQNPVSLKPAVFPVSGPVMRSYKSK
jgi:iron complex transport system ATP-binding protein